MHSLPRSQMRVLAWNTILELEVSRPAAKDAGMEFVCVRKPCATNFGNFREIEKVFLKLGMELCDCLTATVLGKWDVLGAGPQCVRKFWSFGHISPTIIRRAARCICYLMLICN